MINPYASPDDAAVATAGARAGADVVRTMYGRRLNRIDKGAGDFATAADVKAGMAVLGVIRAARPDDAVLGEEGGQQGAVDAVRQWSVDPLCGTLNYAVGTMLVAVDGALRDGAAAVADPFSGEVFFTDGKTARVRHEGADDALLTPAPVTRLVDVDLDPPFPSAPGFRAVDLPAHPELIERFRPRVVSTTPALAWVAGGRRAAYVTDGDDLSRGVHFAAGIALCRAAGCVVTGIDGAPIGETGRGLVVAADEETHGLLISMMRSRSQCCDRMGSTGPGQAATWRGLSPRRMPFSLRIRDVHGLELRGRLDRGRRRCAGAGRRGEPASVRCGRGGRSRRR